MAVSNTGPTPSDVVADRLADRYVEIRRFTERLREPLSAEDCVIQSMPDVSPIRWHLAHTSWFFETFFLSEQPSYRVFHPQFNYLFNSYYNTVGRQFPRPRRGLISRPGLEEIQGYREYVDKHMLQRLHDGPLPPRLGRVVEIGLHHEQQHQELMLTDIKHVLSRNPLHPAYLEAPSSVRNEADPLRWIEFPEGLFEIGHDGNGFAYDNESPRHRVFLERFQLASRPVTCGEFLEFIQDGGYERPELWLSVGWQHIREHGWKAPLYWTSDEGSWKIFSLAGLRAVDPAEPVCHVSYFEADAFATWSSARLPTEAEWETASAGNPVEGHFVDTLLQADLPIHPLAPLIDKSEPAGMFGDVWEWTASSYSPYPRFRPLEGALGEYNGKFMCNQYVLRGGSCATSQSHMRRTYRNFFPPGARWQFMGIRLAR